MPTVDFTSLRSLADAMEAVQTRSLLSFDGSAFLGPEIELAARFGHLLVRHLGLCQLVRIPFMLPPPDSRLTVHVSRRQGQAMTGIVSDRMTMSELAKGWDLIDFESIKSENRFCLPWIVIG